MAENSRMDSDEDSASEQFDDYGEHSGSVSWGDYQYGPPAGYHVSCSGFSQPYCDTMYTIPDSTT